MGVYKQDISPYPFKDFLVPSPSQESIFVEKCSSSFVEVSSHTPLCTLVLVFESIELWLVKLLSSSLLLLFH